MSKDGAATKQVAQVEAATQIDRIASETLVIPIVGTSPLITHRFSSKAKLVMLDRMRGKKTPREAKDPEAEFKAACYMMNGPESGFGIPAVSFKAATVSAARFYPKNDVTMTGLRQFMFFAGEIGQDRQALVRILGDEVEGEWPRMREDVVRVNRGGSDLRYRPEFWPWRVELKVTYVTSALTRGSILSLIDAGGLGVGVGEWRVEKKGDFGTYRVDVDREVEVIEG